MEPDEAGKEVPAMKPPSRLTGLMIELVGSAAICGMVLATEFLLQSRRRAA
jgi:hypothetical protein